MPWYGWSAFFLAVFFTSRFCALVSRLDKRCEFRLELICRVEGIEGIMTSYKQALFNVSLRPTKFRHVVNAAKTIANPYLAANQKKYFVLLVITVCMYVLTW